MIPDMPGIAPVNEQLAGIAIYFAQLLARTCGCQKSRRNASCPVRFPPSPCGNVAVNTPKVLELLMFNAGGAKFV